MELSLPIVYKNHYLGPYLCQFVILEASLSFTLTFNPLPSPIDFLSKCLPSSAPSLGTAPPPSLGHRTTAAPGSHPQALPHSSKSDLKCKYNQVPSYFTSSDVSYFALRRKSKLLHRCKVFFNQRMLPPFSSAITDFFSVLLWTLPSA